MRKILSIPAYLWAVACFLLVPVTFVKNDAFAKQLATLSFMKVHPVYSGGEVNRTYEKDSLLITVNKTVAVTLVGDRKQMVQVSFSKGKQLPGMIDQTIDYDLDGNSDFRVIVNTSNGETNLTPIDQTVKSLWLSSRLKEDWVIRVNLEK
ncbi:MAG: hypothetical protein JW830_06800 [Bacteroidales bacterium]|nr:hypothetical protein [Bacteroidales bacterium]